MKSFEPQSVNFLPPLHTCQEASKDLISFIGAFQRTCKQLNRSRGSKDIDGWSLSYKHFSQIPQTKCFEPQWFNFLSPLHTCQEASNDLISVVGAFQRSCNQINRARWLKDIDGWSLSYKHFSQTPQAKSLEPQWVNFLPPLHTCQESSKDLISFVGAFQRTCNQLNWLRWARVSGRHCCGFFSLNSNFAWFRVSNLKDRRSGFTEPITSFL